MKEFVRVCMSRYFFILVLLLSGFSCATTDLPPIRSGGKTFQMEDDERQLWQDADRLEKRINRSNCIYKDLSLESYIEEITRKLAPEGLGTQEVKLRIKILKDSHFNAFALPNGAIYLNTGILSRFDNEAQLATLLGHELAHITHRHAIKEMRNTENKIALVQALRLLVVVAGSSFGLGLFVLGDDVDQLWALSAIRGYSRELETEADEDGFSAMIRAGYDPLEAPRVFEHLMWERDEEKVKEPYFFATHPKLQERLDNYRRLLQNLPTSARLKEQRLVGIDSYQSRIETVLIENAVMDLERGRYKAARAALERALNRASQSPRVHFLLGELHRKSGSRSANIESAVTAYQKAIRLDPNYGEPHRELGFLYRAQGRKEEAYSEFQTYIRLCLQATDVPIIKGFLKELKGNTNGGSNHDPARLGEVR